MTSAETAGLMLDIEGLKTKNEALKRETHALMEQRDELESHNQDMRKAIADLMFSVLKAAEGAIACGNQHKPMPDVIAEEVALAWGNIGKTIGAELHPAGFYGSGFVTFTYQSSGPMRAAKVTTSTLKAVLDSIRGADDDEAKHPG